MDALDSEEKTVEIWRNEMNLSLRELTKAQNDVLLEVKQRPTRQEIEIMLSTKVSLESFNLEMRGVKEDIAAIQGQPAKARAWISTVVAVGGCLTAVLSTVLSVGITLLIFIANHWH